MSKQKHTAEQEQALITQMTLAMAWDGWLAHEYGDTATQGERRTAWQTWQRAHKAAWVMRQKPREISEQAWDWACGGYLMMGNAQPRW